MTQQELDNIIENCEETRIDLSHRAVHFIY